MVFELKRSLPKISLSWLKSRKVVQSASLTVKRYNLIPESLFKYFICFALVLTAFIFPGKAVADMRGYLNDSAESHISLYSYRSIPSAIKRRYSLLDNGKNERFSLNLQYDNEEQPFVRSLPANKQKSEYIETRILISHEAIKFLAGSVSLVIGTLAGTLIAINSSNPSKKCGGDTCTSEGPSSESLLGGLLSGGVLGASAGVTLSGYLLQEDGNFFITLAGSIALPFLLVFISDPTLSNIPPWAIEASFPAMLAGSMVTYDLSRTHSNKKGVSLLYYPLISVKKDKRNNLDIAVNMIELSL